MPRGIPNPDTREECNGSKNWDTWELGNYEDVTEAFYNNRMQAKAALFKRMAHGRFGPMTHMKYNPLFIAAVKAYYAPIQYQQAAAALKDGGDRVKLNNSDWKYLAEEMYNEWFNGGGTTSRDDPRWIALYGPKEEVQA
jgi:hypothetical protein